MGIPISNLQEGCCDTHLDKFSPIDGDSLDSVGSTCDKIIECNKKYYLIEKKSLLMGFLIYL